MDEKIRVTISGPCAPAKYMLIAMILDFLGEQEMGVQMQQSGLDSEYLEISAVQREVSVDDE